jgi:hypothetical protein
MHKITIVTFVTIKPIRIRMKNNNFAVWKAFSTCHTTRTFWFEPVSTTDAICDVLVAELFTGW